MENASDLWVCAMNDTLAVRAVEKQTWHENQLLPIFLLAALGRVKVIFSSSRLFICFSPLNFVFSNLVDNSVCRWRNDVRKWSEEAALQISSRKFDLRSPILSVIGTRSASLLVFVRLPFFQMRIRRKVCACSTTDPHLQDEISTPRQTFELNLTFRKAPERDKNSFRMLCAGSFELCASLDPFDAVIAKSPFGRFSGT